MTREKIWELYLPKEEEMLFHYMEKYKSLIVKKKEEVLKSDEKLVKYALVSLFQLYRSCNHMGVRMSSYDYHEFPSPDRERLGNIELVIGQKLENTAHYLQLIGANTFWFYNPFLSFGRKLYRVVIKS